MMITIYIEILMANVQIAIVLLIDFILLSYSSINDSFAFILITMNYWKLIADKLNRGCY